MIRMDVMSLHQGTIFPFILIFLFRAYFGIWNFVFRHFFRHNATKLWLASCDRWRKPVENYCLASYHWHLSHIPRRACSSFATLSHTNKSETMVTISSFKFRQQAISIFNLIRITSAKVLWWRTRLLMSLRSWFVNIRSFRDVCIFYSLHPYPHNQTSCECLCHHFLRSYSQQSITKNTKTSHYWQYFLSRAGQRMSYCADISFLH